MPEETPGKAPDTKIVKLPVSQTKRSRGFLDIYQEIVKTNSESVQESIEEFSGLIKATVELMKTAEETERDITASPIEQLTQIETTNDLLNDAFYTLQAEITALAKFNTLEKTDLAEYALEVALEEFVEAGVLNDAKTKEKLKTMEYYKQNYENVIFKLYDVSTGRRKEVEEIQYQFTKTNIPGTPIKPGTMDRKRFELLMPVINEKLNGILAKTEDVRVNLKAFVEELSGLMQLFEAYGKSRGLEDREMSLKFIEENPFFKEHLSGKLKLPATTATPESNVFEFKELRATLVMAALVTIAVDGGFSTIGGEYFQLQNEILDTYIQYYSESAQAISGSQEELAIAANIKPQQVY